MSYATLPVTVEAARVHVSVWGELRGESRVRGSRRILRVLVAGQYAGAVWWDADGWHASRQARVLAPPRESTHPTAEAAVRAVLRSGFARRLGARAQSPRSWTPRALRELGSVERAESRRRAAELHAEGRRG